MLIFDAHLDLAWNALDWNRNLQLPCEQIRKLEVAAGETEKGRGGNTVSFPDLRRGKVVTFVATVLARLFRPGSIPPIQDYSQSASAFGAAMGQLHYYRGLEQQGVLRFIKDWPTLESHVNAWKIDENSTTLPLGFILSMEGADAILRPDQVQEWWDAGLRIIGPCLYGVSPYGHGTSTEGGFFPQGRELLKEMQRVGMILDVTHLSDQCFDEAMDLFGGRLLASHHNNRTLVSHQRQLTDAQTKTIIARGGVIGHAFDIWMVVPNYVRGETKAEVPLERLCDHIDRVCQLAGNARHAAIGSDLDGGFGREQSPSDLDTIADLQRLIAVLTRRGYTPIDIEGILHANWLRFFKEAWTGQGPL
ncbi:MAG: peptidase M19 [Gemmataceae bacterium]|nr:peptidase M19 [Gemmataceae bacterium]